MSYETNKWATDDLITHQKLNNIEDGVTMALEKVVYGTGGAQVPSEGHHTTIWLNEGDPMPGNPTVTDVVYVKNGDDYIIYEWDGSAWAVRLDPRIGERVDTAIKEAKEYSDNLVIENGTEVNNTINEVKTEQENLQKGLDQLDTKAQDYANKALTDARADIATTAQDLTKKVKQETDDRVKAVSDATTHADSIVATAKSDLANTIAKETGDRNAAVADLDTKAQGYATTAKNDAISASTTALNTAKTDLTTSLNKEVTDRANAVTALDTKAKGYADTAKADAIATANGAVAKEVTDRQKAITDLDAKSTGAINQAKNDAQSALNALQVGGRNWLLDSKTAHSATGNNTVNQVNASHSYTLASNMSSGDMFTKFSAGSPFTLSFDWVVTGTTITGGFFPQWGGTPWGFNAPTVALSGTNTSGHYIYVGKIGSTWSGTSARTIQFRMDNVQGVLTLTNAKLEIGNKATDHTQAPEDIVLDYTTKDNVISQSLTQYQATNDGKVTKAQSDATQALGLVATKVSQTTFDTKTGDLDSKYTAVKQTADQASTDIVAIKSDNKSQDTKINTITSDVNGTKQSISDIQTEQGKQSTKINTIQTDVSGTKQEISDIKDANGVQDGKIVSISTTVDGLTSSFSTYKTTNDGKVAKAQADITANATAISQKVSQTAYDAKTGQLQTDLNTTTTTANQAKTDIVAIKKTNTDQDARMTTIESDANGVKTTVSSLQTTANTQAGSISTLQQRADGFDATVTKVNNLSVGGTNLVSGTNQEYQMGYGIPETTWQDGYAYLKLPTNIINGEILPQSPHTFFYTLSQGTTYTQTIWFETDATVKDLSVAQITWYTKAGHDVQPAIIQKLGQNSYKIVSTYTWPGKTDNNVRLFDIERLDSAFNLNTGTYLKFGKLKLEKGNLATDWSPAPEDVDGATAKAQLTADNASLALSNYKTDADGRISKAQADIVVNANAITQKVSQTEYNAKTGDLTTKVNTAQSTADSANSTISAYKTSNDGRVASAESKITQNTTAITTKVSQTVYDAKTNQLQTDLNTTTNTANTSKQDIVAIKSDNTKQDARMTTIESDANGTKTTVSNLQTDLGTANGSITTLQQRADGFDATVTKVNDMSVGGRNLLLDTATRTAVGPNAFNNTPAAFRWTLAGGLNVGDLYTAWGNNSPISLSFDWSITGTTIAGGFSPQWSGAPWGIGVTGAPGVTVSSTNKSGHYTWSSTTQTGWSGSTANLFTLRTDNLQGTLTITNLKFEQGNLPTTWSPSPEDVDSATAKAQLTADQATTTINTYKTSNDGRVATAESNISQNATAITQKVSQTDYNQKTGQLQTDLNTTTNTANTAKQDIATIKTDNTTRDSKINTLESDSTETKRTISKLSGDLSTVSGDVSTLKQTAQGFEATVTKVNNMSVGGRNYVLNTNVSTTSNITGFYSTVPSSYFNNKKLTVSVQLDYDNITALSGQKRLGVEFVILNKDGSNRYVGSWKYPAVGDSFHGRIYTTWDFSNNEFKDIVTNQMGQGIYVQDITGTNVSVSKPKLEIGTSSTDWTPAPEDIDSSISSVKQTADSASTAITNYKTSNDGRVSAAEGAIKTNADAITQKVSIVDYNTNNGTVSTRIGEIETANDKITQSVSSLTTQVNAMGQINQLFNTEFSPDFAGWGYWDGDMKKSTSNITNSRLVISNRYKGSNKMLTDSSIDARYVTSTIPISISSNQPMVARVTAESDKAGSTLRLHISFHDANGIQTGNVNTVGNLTTTPQDIVVAFNGPLPPNTVSAYLVVMVVGKAAWTQPMVIYGDTIGAYTPGAYNSTQKIASQQITIDSISDVVSNPTTGLSKRVQTAEGTLSQVTGADIPALQKATYWQPYGSLDLNTYKTQGSYYFNSTTAKPNGPTTSTDWMYMQVEVANSDKVTQIVWYDKTTSAKITYKRQYAGGTWSPWYANDNDSVTSISQTNGAIQQEVKDRTNGDSNTLTQAKDFTTSAITSSEGKTNTLVTQTSDAIIAQVNANNIVSNSEFDPLNKGWYPIGTTVGSVPGSEAAPGSYTTSFGDWQIADGSQLLNYYSSTWYSTDLVPAQAQVVYSASIVAGRTGVLTNSVALDLRIAFFDGTKKLLGYASAGNIITASAYSGLKLYKFENQMAPANTRYVSLVIAHSGAPAGGSDIIGRPTLNYGAKVTTYSPTKSSTASSVQLALMKDNWSIGINDNTGKLASGIAADANAMAVVSPKVIINSPQTQITGKLTAAQIDTKELSAISAVLGNVSSGSITNPISGQRSGHGNATIAGKTVIDAGGINMTADMLVGGSKVNSEQLQFSPDTGIIFKWNNAQGNVVRNTTVDEYGVTVSSGGPYTAGFSEMGFDIGNNVGGNAQVGIGGVYSTEFQRYRQSFTGQNLEIRLDFIRQGNLVMVNTNITTYGPTLQGDRALMSGGKIPVGFRPVWPVDMVLNANTSGGQQSGMVVSLDTDGQVYKTGPAWGGVMRVMGHTTYMTFTVGPSTQNYTAVSDGYGNITP